MSSVQYRPDIDGLRALAVVPVLLFHVDPALMPGGFLGVDIFFVISGYLISLILYREQALGSLSISGFYGRRIRRLFPALLVVLGAVLGFGFFALLADEYLRLGRDGASAIFFLLNFRLMGQAGYFDVVSYSKPLMHLWSLSVEEQFYVLWPLLLLLLGRIRAHPGWVVAICTASSLLYAAAGGFVNPDTAYYNPLTRFWELLVGAGVALLQARAGTNGSGLLRHPIVRDCLSVAGLLLTASALWFFSKSVAHPGWATLWPVAGVAMLIVSGAASWANRLLAFRPLVLVGLISYPLYLWHWPMLSFVRIMDSGTPAPSALWLAVALSVALAWLTYRWVEQPIRNTPQRARATRLLLLGMLVLVAACAAIMTTKGLPDRAALQYLQVFQNDLTREQARDDACVSRFGTDRAPVYCRQRDAGDSVLALIGDSHAHVLFSGVSELASRRGVGTWMLANSACPPFLGTTWGRSESARQACTDSIDTIVDAVVRDRRVVSVVIASRGPVYLDGTGYGAVEAHLNNGTILASGPPGDSTHADPAAVFARGLLATARRLHEAGKKVSYLIQPPELGMAARECLGRPLGFSARVHQCEVRYEDYARRMATYRALVKDLADQAPFLRLIDVEPLFCGAKVCNGVVGDQLLYTDDNHLSVTGSRRVAPLVLRQALDAEDARS